MTSSPKPPELVFARDLRLIGETPGATSAVLHRVRRGVYAARDDWRTADFDRRHRVAMQAVAATRRHDPVFSHASAALLWGIPIVGNHLQGVHLQAWNRTAVRSKNGVVWHHDALDDSEVVEFDGHFLTSFARTLIDLARTLPFASAIAALDFGIGAGGAARVELAGLLAQQTGRRGVRKARAAVSFADARSGSPGESISRANMHLLHFPPPRLQVPFSHAHGVDITDFDWPEFDAFGEFDGFGKYIKEEYVRGRPIQEIVVAEKERENRIRKHRRFGARWDWDIARTPRLLANELLQAGLRPVR